MGEHTSVGEHRTLRGDDGRVSPVPCHRHPSPSLSLSGPKRSGFCAHKSAPTAFIFDFAPLPCLGALLSAQSTLDERGKKKKQQSDNNTDLRAGVNSQQNKISAEMSNEERCVATTS